MTKPSPIRYVIWSAVSTEEQADDDKYSLISQVESSRAIANGKNWVEVAPPYIVPGESRTRWINLSDAERAIPPLKLLLDDAQAGKFDVVVCYEFDRFRELLDPVARTLSHYGVQLYSVSQPLDPQDPGQYSPYQNDSEFILRGMNQMISRAAIANLRRKYLTQMPRRISEKGLPGAALSYGYRKPAGHETDENAIPEQIPAIVEHILRMKDRLFAGWSTYQIAAELDSLGAPPPKPHLRGAAGPRRRQTQWDATTVNRILTNPFYAGFVRWGITKSKLDPRSGKTVREVRPANQVIRATGKHVPLWDEDTLTAIQAELGRRSTGHRGHITRQLTGLLRCSVCGAMLWRHTRGSKTNSERQYITWRCSFGFATHVVVADDLMLSHLAAELVRHISAQDDSPMSRSYEKDLESLREKRTRIGDAYAAGLFSMDEFSKRVQGVDAEIASLENLQTNENARRASSETRARVVEMLRSIPTQEMNDYLRNGNLQEINAVLHRLVSKIVVDPGGNFLEVVPA